MPIDREYIVAAFSGMLHGGVPTDAFIAKYDLSDSEQRRAAIVAIQALMQQYYVECRGGGVAPVRVRSIATRYGIRGVELEHMAWEVLRGVVETASTITIRETETDEIVAYIVRRFLLDHLPVKTRFGFYDHCAVFQPRVVPPGSARLLRDAASNTVDGSPISQYPPEAIELLRDAGLKV